MRYIAATRFDSGAAQTGGGGGASNPGRAASIRDTQNQPKQHAAINIPSGRVSDAPARLVDAASNPQRLPL